MYIYGFPGDILTYLYGIWRWNADANYIIFPNQIFFTYFIGTPIKLLGPVAGINIAIFLMFLASFVIFYRVFSSKLVKEASLVGAFIYSFSQYLIWHAFQNPEIVLASAFIPLLIGKVIEFESRPLNLKEGLRQSFLMGAVLSLIFLASFYIGYFSAIATVVLFAFFRLWDLLVKRVLIVSLLRGLSIYAFILVTFLIITLPVTYPFIQYKLGNATASEQDSIQQGSARNTLLDLIAFGARPWDYLMPPIYHPFWGGQVRQFHSFVRERFTYQYWSTFLPERVNYIPVTALFLALFVIYRSFWPRKKELLLPVRAEDKKVILALVFLAAAMFFVSLPPVITIGGQSIYFPSYFLFKVFPMFRVYARAGIFVLFGVAALAAFSWDRFLSSNLKRSALATTLIILLIVFENLTFPPLPIMDVSQVPKVYSWLKNNTGNVLIAEYPKDNSVNDLGGGCPDWLGKEVTREYNRTYELFYQTIHQKRILDYTSLAKEDKIAIGNLESAQAFKLLKSYGVGFVVVHSRDPIIGIHPWPYPQENPLDDCWQRRIMRKPYSVSNEFTLVAEFDDGAVYKVQ